ncbi:Gfo/Idh/MocA family protein [Gorillibacterium sp. sgz5001074]|uniref:Gfo/Idh/MocA family protein n=1 Tax=Gorillibacterium sp. sgz5001074 TaxID=3446695 RepID=UPI003F6783E5
MAVRFAIVGSGWRAEFFLRIAEALPERFRVTDMVVRDPAKAEAVSRRWGVRVHADAGGLPADGCFDFAVVSVPRQAAPELILELTERGIPVLCETPPAPDLETLQSLHRRLPKGARVQVAEQYIFQPHHAARLAIVRSGRLGTVTQAQVSAAHDYHGISLIRHLLGAGFEEAEIEAYSFTAPIVAGPSRSGPPEREELADSEQTIARIDFGGKLGVYDFTRDQYFSWIRGPRVLVRGERGEIHNEEVRYLRDFRTPVETGLRRIQAGAGGNLEGFHLKGILLGEEEIYRNPYAPGRLSDDEIAVATCLGRMGEYIGGGSSFYSLAEASQDHYLSLLIKQAAASRQKIRTERQIWADPV